MQHQSTIGKLLVSGKSAAILFGYKELTIVITPFFCFSFGLCVCPAFIGVCSGQFHNSGTIFLDYGEKAIYSLVLFFMQSSEQLNKAYVVRNSVNCSFAVVSTLH